MLGFYFRIFFQITSKIQQFINSDDCIEKIISIFVRLYPVFIQKKGLNLIKKGIISSEKIRYPGN